MTERSKIMKPIWTARISGRPKRNFAMRILWWKRNIPTIDPMLPPMMATVKSTASGIRKRRSMARILSEAIVAIPIKLMKIKYKIRMILASIQILHISCQSVIHNAAGFLKPAFSYFNSW